MVWGSGAVCEDEAFPRAGLKNMYAAMITMNDDDLGRWDFSDHDANL